jgi:Zn-finger nucleic acid-binding protein
MRLLDGRDYFACDYCATFHFPQGGLRADGVKSLDQRSDLVCSICTTPLVAGMIVGRRVQFCEQCWGVLAAGTDFAEIVRVRRASYKGATDPPRPADPRELARDVACPVCRGPMETHPYYGPGGVTIDSCGHCALVWLDRGELGMIERAPGKR